MASLGVERVIVGKNSCKTTVLATEIDKPNKIPAPQGQPKPCAVAVPSAVVRAICTRAPGIATDRTARSSFKLN
jgi:hypothetical protein